MPHIARPALSRRAFLRGAGVALSLPMLDAMTPAFGQSTRASGRAADVPRRMVCIQTNQGIMPQFFFPEAAGRGYAATPYLKRLAEHRDRITVFSGVSLPGVTGGHQAERCFLTGTPAPRARRVPQRHLARPVRRRAGRQPDPVPLARPGDDAREPDAQLHAQRRPDPVREEPEEPVPEALRPGQAGGGRPGGRGPRTGAEHARLPRRGDRQAQPLALRGRPLAARPVLHLRPRAGAADARLGGLGAEAQAGRRRQAAGGPPRGDTSSSPRPGSSST